MGYIQLKAAISATEQEHTAISNALRAYPHTGNGLTCQDAKDGKYYALKARQQMLFTQLRHLNSIKVKQFKKEYTAERKNKSS